MHESFGARLRQRRERQRITLATIAEQTKIKASLLEELERDDVSHWPVGIFRRAFVRSYAQAIGLEPAVILEEFLAHHPDPFDMTVDSSDVSAEVAKQHTRPPTRLRFLVGSALGSLGRGRQGAVRTPGSPVGDPAATEPSIVPTAFEPDLLAAARLCTALSQVDQRSEMAVMLAETVRILDAIGLVIWVWDPRANELRAVLAHGYPETLLAQLPPVKRTSDNATAAAFRSSETSVVAGSDHASGAIVVPLMTPGGCGGVLAIELPNGREQTDALRAVATILAAQLARWIRSDQAEVRERRLA
jgi:transcriptional regulator with XRE-family HTH domain